MSKSYQHEIPPARVNITLDVDSNGTRSQKELPMKLLMLGDFSHGQASGLIAKRDRVNVNKHNFNQVMGDLRPKLSTEVPNRLNVANESMQVSLEFQSIQDFKPEQIVQQVPQLQRLMAMRNLLKDLKACVIDNQAFRKSLEQIMKDDEASQKLLAELASQSPLAQD